MRCKQNNNFILSSTGGGKDLATAAGIANSKDEKPNLDGAQTADATIKGLEGMSGNNYNLTQLQFNLKNYFEKEIFIKSTFFLSVFRRKYNEFRQQQNARRLNDKTWQ